MSLTLQVTPIFDETDGKPRGLAPKRRLDADLLATLKPSAYKAKITKLRSRRADSLFHKCIAVACENWPNWEEPWPKGDKELLRYWLQCKVGPHWRRTADFSLGDEKSARMLIEYFAGEGRYAFTEHVETATGTKFRVHIPMSIKHEHMDEEDFAPLRQAVLEMLELRFDCTALELAAHGETA